MNKIYEKDLYEPIKIYFENEGYIVNSEVKDCDIVLSKEDDLIIIEMKKAISLQLVYQAIERKKITNHVYVAILYSEREKKTFTKFANLMKIIDVGIILVNLDAIVNYIYIVAYPAKIIQKNNKKTFELIDEIENRSGNYNVSGVNHIKLFTAYKEEALFIACILFNRPLKLKEIKNKISSSKVDTILSKNYYNWFKKIERGVYGITDTGIIDIEKYREITEPMFKILREREKDD